MQLQQLPKLQLMMSNQDKVVAILRPLTPSDFDQQQEQQSDPGGEGLNLGLFRGEQIDLSQDSSSTEDCWEQQLSPWDIFEEEMLVFENELVDMEKEIKMCSKSASFIPDNFYPESSIAANGAANDSSFLSYVNCEICGEPFEGQPELELHLLRSHKITKSRQKGLPLNDGKFMCPLCATLFMNPTNLHLHMRRIHPDRTDVVKCKVCDRFFRTELQLTRHSRIHTDERPFECETCRKTFPWPEHLKAHKKVHYPFRQHVCAFCQSTFTSNSARNKHERIHKRQFRYTCEECGEGFHVSEPYKVHLRKHVGVRPFQCGQCGKQRHTIVHLDLRPFPCNECKKSFRDKQTLDRHKLVHSGLKPFRCPHCKMGLATKHNVKEHVKKIHPEK